MFDTWKKGGENRLAPKVMNEGFQVALSSTSIVVPIPNVVVVELGWLNVEMGWDGWVRVGVGWG